jgi:LmbE family N-acetylglucosaminyl deacetylase
VKVVVLAPHPDDESIGCGGAVLRHLQTGDSVAVVFLTSGELGLQGLPAAEARALREREAEAACAVLGVGPPTFLRRPDWSLAEGVDEAAEALAPFLTNEDPALVYVPHEGEAHPDHRAALPILRVALGQRRPDVLAYEIWSPLQSWHDVVDVTDVIDTKLEAIRCYRSQLDQFRYDDAVLGLNQYRGALAGSCRYAEAFRHGNLEGELEAPFGTTSTEWAW